MEIEYVDQLPPRFRKQAAALFLEALGEKLAPILGEDFRAKQALLAGMDSSRCLAAIQPDGQLLGVLAIHTAEGGFIEPTFADLREIYGFLGAVQRIIGLSFLAHTTHPDTWHLEGIAVRSSARGQGVGSHLLARFYELAVTQPEIKKLTLQVVDTNERARDLYQRNGFTFSRDESAWPLNRLFKFPFSRVATMERAV